LATEGYEDGWAFKRPNGNRAKAVDYQNILFTKLEKIQETTNLIESECKTWDDFGIQRLGRRCSTTVCTNQNIPEHLVELQCRWSTDPLNGVRTVQRLMVHNYSEIRNMKDSLICPSEVF